MPYRDADLARTQRIAELEQELARCREASARIREIRSELASLRADVDGPSPRLARLVVGGAALGMVLAVARVARPGRSAAPEVEAAVSEVEAAVSDERETPIDRDTEALAACVARLPRAASFLRLDDLVGDAAALHLTWSPAGDGDGDRPVELELRAGGRRHSLALGTYPWSVQAHNISYCAGVPPADDSLCKPSWITPPAGLIASFSLGGHGYGATWYGGWQVARARDAAFVVAEGRFDGDLCRAHDSKVLLEIPLRADTRILERVVTHGVPRDVPFRCANWRDSGCAG